MRERINIVLPGSTIQTIDRLARPGQRSRFIDNAVRHYVRNCSKEALRRQLELTAVRDRDLDGEITADWFAADQHIWQQSDEPTPGSQPPEAGRDLPHRARPTLGLEIQKTRPALIIRNDISNRFPGYHHRGPHR